ncbi:ASCH domain-containing protein [Burkholderia vietnamiensis]|uniref:ASCH domain-containing protein n=1 Tax=Burkholderia vietnamiensis TaxID=60552 RepID=UPI002010E0D5|nr:ASCH domain-containing protein [Burkholderia vietnamiensis]
MTALIKAISIRQPYAWLIVRPDISDLAAREAAYRDDLLKTIENRVWGTRYRGPLLIHASKGMTRAEYEDADDPLWSVGGPTIELPPFDDLQRGGFIGAAVLDACVPSSERTSWWHIDGQFGLRLKHVRPVPFVECKGALMLFDVPSEVLQQLRPHLDGLEQLPAA